jgi:hypothetical protein
MKESSMQDATFINAVAGLAETQEFQVEGKTFTSKPVHEVKPEPPKLAAKVQVFTLQGFADLLREKIEDLDPTGFLIHITKYNEVVLISKETDEHGRRLELLKAQPVEFEQFKFGQFIGQEEFVIAVASRFVSTPDKDYVLQVASSLTNEAISISEDDGFKQKATIKQGLKVADTVQLKPTVSLAPYRTFPEVGQPISQFVFRARCGGGEPPKLMLIEADGGKWKLDAINEVRRFLSTLAVEIPIIA